MGLLNPFGSDSSTDNCEHHHWDEYEEKWNSIFISGYRESMAVRDSEGSIKERTPALMITVPRVRRCQHEGCDATDRKSVDKEYYVPMDFLSEKREVGAALVLARAVDSNISDEIATALKLRATQINDNPDDGEQHVAETLRGLARQIETE